MKESGSKPSLVLIKLCGIVEDYRTFIEDFKRVLEFVEWLEDM